MKEDNNQSRIESKRNIVWKKVLFKATKLTEVVPFLFCMFFVFNFEKFLYFVCFEVNSILSIPIH